MTERRESRIRTTLAALVCRMQALTVFGYMGVASLIGVETLIVVLGFTTVLPIAIPFVLIVFAAVYFFRERVRGLWRATRARFAGSGR
ncbi:hypothetical protein [Glycomyces sp. NRRL B-16210]|uniref:hypothetical protein n=1 Tax=Glycomyces sp. NRRL B-16210 TaxID=1463821 RepID=UPI0004BEBD46|nr:hypothetical protein [Glycomyces sp. NRRL B-16210]